MDGLQVNRREIFRYLGYGRTEPDQRTADRVEEALAELEKNVTPRYRVREWPLTVTEEGEIDGGCFQTVSAALSKNLKECTRLLTFAATLGPGADYLIRRYERLEMSRAVIVQAASAAMIEAYCDRVCSVIKEQYEADGWYLRPRFSPGYGDFPLECQTPLLSGLEAGKHLGIRLTDSLLMVPSKSVSAVMGLSRKPCRCEVKGCEACEKTECSYRRQS